MSSLFVHRAQVGVVIFYEFQTLGSKAKFPIKGENLDTIYI